MTDTTKRWGVWAVANGYAFYLGEVTATHRGKAKKKAQDLEIWKNHPHFNGINPHKWELMIGAAKEAK